MWEKEIVDRLGNRDKINKKVVSNKTDVEKYVPLPYTACKRAKKNPQNPFTISQILIDDKISTKPSWVSGTWPIVYYFRRRQEVKNILSLQLSMYWDPVYATW